MERNSSLYIEVLLYSCRGCGKALSPSVLYPGIGFPYQGHGVAIRNDRRSHLWHHEIAPADNAAVGPQTADVDPPDGNLGEGAGRGRRGHVSPAGGAAVQS